MAKRGTRIAAFFLIVLLIGGVIGAAGKDIAKGISLGLDLRGGFEILYEVKPAKKGDKIDRDVLVSTVGALENRVNVLGVSEPNIQIEGQDRIRVQLAGVQDQQKAREMLSTQAKLTFRDVDDNLLMDGTDLKGGAIEKPILSSVISLCETLATLNNAFKPIFFVIRICFKPRFTSNLFSP